MIFLIAGRWRRFLAFLCLTFVCRSRRAPSVLHTDKIERSRMDH